MKWPPRAHSKMAACFRVIVVCFPTALVVTDKMCDDLPVISNKSDDLYAYLDRDAFTSEKFKIEIRGLPKFYGIKEFKKLLNEKLRLDLCKVKPSKRGGGWVFVSFRNEEARQHAITTITGYTWKGHKLTAKPAKPSPDPYIRQKLKNKAEQRKKAKVDSNEVIELSVEDLVKESTTPLWSMPYAEQLEFKQTQMRAVMTKVDSQISHGNSVLNKWRKKQHAEYDGMICDLKPIISTGKTEGYRNKCEFTIGKNQTYNEIVIGFRLSSYAQGSTDVGPINELYHVPEIMKTAVKIFKKFIEASDLNVYDPVNQSGYWNQLTARTTRLDHLMLIVGLYPQDLSPEALSEQKAKVRAFFEDGEGREAHVTSLYFQILGKKGPGGEIDSQSLEHLSGSTHIEESLLQLKFRISPLAFFQVNTSGAELLYQTAIDLAQCDRENTSILDICCGTGTIGLCFAKYCSEVLGLEVIADAIKDARENARVNGIDNCEFFVGKAEDIVKAVIHRTTKRHIVAIVDPPRAGLHHQALLALRGTKKLTKLLYISCDPKAAMQNLVDFARPTSKQYLGEPLVPVTAIPVDMFPHTSHCELVVLLQRLETPEPEVSTQ